EAYIGADGIGRRLGAAIGQPYGPELLPRLLATDVLPPAVLEVFHTTVGYLGAGIGDLINLFSPERIVLGGVAGSVLGARFLPEIRQAAARHALRRPYAQTSIELCQLGVDAVAMGAATLPTARLLEQGGLAEPGLVVETEPRPPWGRPASARAGAGPRPGR
ncbi:MAG: ROK family protein, partial [Actinoplanes sp.]